MGHRVSAVGSLFGNFSYETPSTYPYLYQREGVGRDAGAPLRAARALQTTINILYETGVQLLRAWLHRPRRVEAAPPEKRRIIPAKLAMAREGDRSNNRFAKFASAAHVVQQQDGRQLAMPGFERADYRYQKPNLI